MEPKDYKEGIANSHSNCTRLDSGIGSGLDVAVGMALASIHWRQMSPKAPDFDGNNPRKEVETPESGFLEVVMEVD